MDSKPRSIKIDGLPDRLAHLRKIAARIKLDHPEFAADDPSRATECDEDGGSMKNGEVSNLDTLRPAD